MLVIETTRELPSEIATLADLVFNAYTGHILHSTEEGAKGYLGKNHIYINLNLPYTSDVVFRTDNPKDYVALGVLWEAISKSEQGRCVERNAKLEQEKLDEQTRVDQEKSKKIQALDSWVVTEMKRREDWIMAQKEKRLAEIEDAARNSKVWRNRNTEHQDLIRALVSPWIRDS